MRRYSRNNVLAGQQAVALAVSMRWFKGSGEDQLGKGIKNETFTPGEGPMKPAFAAHDPSAGTSHDNKPDGTTRFGPEDFKEWNRHADPASGAAKEQHADEQSKKRYVRSQEYFGHKTVTLKQSYSGSEEAQKVTAWERVWWDYVRYWWTGEKIVGKDRYGNIFTKKWFAYRGRNEMRKCHRKDKNKRFQPYGCLPTDSKMWESWQRGWRHDPPQPGEEEVFRRRNRKRMGPNVLGEEEIEDTIVRSAAHNTHAAAHLQELDTQEQHNRFMYHFEEQRDKEANAHREASTWTVGFSRGDYFYNEEETETMRTNMANVFRDKEWQSLEMKRQTRMRKQPWSVGRPPDGPDFYDPNGPEGQPIKFEYDRIDGGVPCMDGVEQLTTPELQKLHVECDQLEEERVALRRELGLTDIGDYRDGRPPVVRDGEDKNRYQPSAPSTRWKPRTWQESFSKINPTGPFG